jgi:hypothetical protein
MLNMHIEELKEDTTNLHYFVNEQSLVVYIETDEENKDIIALSYDKYNELLSYRAKYDKEIQDELILNIGGQIVGWEDTTASLQEAADYSYIHIDLAVAIVFQLDDIFDDTDGIDRVSFSPIGWEYYLEVKNRTEL